MLIINITIIIKTIIVIIVLFENALKFTPQKGIYYFQTLHNKQLFLEYFLFYNYGKLFLIYLLFYLIVLFFLLVFFFLVMIYPNFTSSSPVSGILVFFQSFIEKK